MSTSGPDDTPPPSELQGLDPKDLLQAGLETVPPVTLPPQPVDSDVTIAVARPQSTQSAPQVELPLPEELTQLLPAGAYHVESFLGQGGMGAVYKASQVRLKRPVAIKIMRRDMGKDYDFEARFEREAQAMAKLNHPNIVSVIDFGEAGPDYLYIVMELIDGADLMDVIRGGQMTQEMALTLLPQVCDALQFAHDHGIVHRDIKPSNIMLTRDGRVKMCDFGLAKRYDVESSFRTQTGTGMGTPDYAAPEQFDPKANIDHRADIYALGVMIYQMITGQLPRGVWKPPSQRAAIAPQWDDIVSRAMQSDPSDRYQHASDIKTDVSSIPLAGKEGSAGTPARPSSNGGAAAKNHEAERSLRAPVKSPPATLRVAMRAGRAPLLFGLIVGSAALAIGAFFALKKPAESGPISPQSGTSDANASAATEPTAIKLWDSADKLPKKPGVAWEDGAVRLDGDLGQGYRLRDLVLRASVRMNPDAVYPQINVRQTNNLTKDSNDYSCYTFGISQATQLFQLSFADRGERKALKTWPFPKKYASDEWCKLELCIVGDELTTKVDDLVLGTVHDSTLKEAGGFNVHAHAKGYFRDIEYVPLDAPAVSPSPNLPASKSSDPKFPPGQWVKLFTKADDLPTDLRMPDSGVTWKDGWLRFDRLKQARPRIELPAAVTGKSNYAVRLRGIGSGKPSFQTGIILRRQNSPSDRHYQFSPQSPVPLKIVRREGDAHFDLARLTKPLVQAGEEYTMEFVALGNYLIGRYNMEIITARDDRFSEGTACISGAEDIRDIEFINLDGLPEAEALKILGVDEKGNHLRGKTNSASSPSSAAVATQFAPGEWVRPFKDITSIHETWIKAGATWVDGWITPGPALNHSITLAAPNGRGKNWGVRALYRWQEKGGAALLLRRTGKATENTVSTYQLKVESSRASFSRVQGNGSKQGAQITELAIAQLMNLEAGDEVVIEAFALGNMLYGSVDGQIFKVPSDGQLSSGDFEAAARLLSYRDIEFINLDGLPEAEALRLLGVDEKGNDLRGK
jgi:predicted Ser/Thr protein kinase